MIRSFFSCIKGRTGALLLAGMFVVGIGVTIVGTSAPAKATGGDCTVYAKTTVPIGDDENITIPTGTYCFKVVGTRNEVSYTTGSFATAWIYNYTEIVRFYDADGHNYRTFTEPVHYGYAYGAHNWRTYIHGTAKAGGGACGTLMSSGRKVATACVGIS